VSPVDQRLSLCPNTEDALRRSSSPDVRDAWQNQMCAAHCSICELHMTDLCDEEGAEETCEQSLVKGHELAPDSPDVRADQTSSH